MTFCRCISQESLDQWFSAFLMLWSLNAVSHGVTQRTSPSISSTHPWNRGQRAAHQRVETEGWGSHMSTFEPSHSDGTASLRWSHYLSGGLGRLEGNTSKIYVIRIRHRVFWVSLQEEGAKLHKKVKSIELEHRRAKGKNTVWKVTSPESWNWGGRFAWFPTTLHGNDDSATWGYWNG